MHQYRARRPMRAPPRCAVASDRDAEQAKKSPGCPGPFDSGPGAPQASRAIGSRLASGVHSALAPDAFTTGPQRAISALMRSAICSGEPAMIS